MELDFIQQSARWNSMQEKNENNQKTYGVSLNLK